MSTAHRTRLYEAYASTHAGLASAADQALAFRRDVLPHLPADRGARVVDLGCGQGELVRQLHRHGYAAGSGIDISPEQVALAHAAGVPQVRLGDFRSALPPGGVDVAVATDLLEHLTPDEALDGADAVRRALARGGRLVVRVPNAVSPFSGNYQHGDLTHQTSYTARSLRQLGAAAGFGSVTVHACPPVVHGLPSAARAAVWKVASGAIKLALAAETGALGGHLVTQNVVGVLDVGER